MSSLTQLRTKRKTLTYQIIRLHILKPSGRFSVCLRGPIMSRQAFLKKCKSTWREWKIFPRCFLPKIKRDRILSNCLPWKIEIYTIKYFLTNRHSNSNCCNWLRPRPPMQGNGPRLISRKQNSSFSHMSRSYKAKSALHWMRPLKHQTKANILRCGNKWISELNIIWDKISKRRSSNSETLSDATSPPQGIFGESLTPKHETQVGEEDATLL